jgi:hypothetical protein
MRCSTEGATYLNLYAARRDLEGIGAASKDLPFVGGQLRVGCRNPILAAFPGDHLSLTRAGLHSRAFRPPRAYR